MLDNVSVNKYSTVLKQWNSRDPYLWTMGYGSSSQRGRNFYRLL